LTSFVFPTVLHAMDSSVFLEVLAVQAPRTLTQESLLSLETAKDLCARGPGKK